MLIGAEGGAPADPGTRIAVITSQSEPPYYGREQEPMPHWGSRPRGRMWGEIEALVRRSYRLVA